MANDLNYSAGPRTLERLARLTDVLTELSRESALEVGPLVIRGRDDDDDGVYARVEPWPLEQWQGPGNRYYVDFGKEPETPKAPEFAPIYDSVTGDVIGVKAADGQIFDKSREKRGAEPTVGTVAVKVVPDFTGFNEALAKELEGQSVTAPPGATVVINQYHPVEENDSAAVARAARFLAAGGAQ